MTLSGNGGPQYRSGAGGQNRSQRQHGRERPAAKAARTQLDERAQAQIKELLGDTRYRISAGLRWTLQRNRPHHRAPPTSRANGRGDLSSPPRSGKTRRPASHRHFGFDGRTQCRPECHPAPRRKNPCAPWWATPLTGDYREHAGGWLNQLSQPTVGAARKGSIDPPQVAS